MFRALHLPHARGRMVRIISVGSVRTYHRLHVALRQRFLLVPVIT